MRGVSTTDVWPWAGYLTAHGCYEVKVINITKTIKHLFHCLIKTIKTWPPYKESTLYPMNSISMEGDRHKIINTFYYLFFY